MTTTCIHPDATDIETVLVGSAEFIVCDECAAEVDNVLCSQTACNECATVFISRWDRPDFPSPIAITYSAYTSVTVTDGSFSYEVQSGELEETADGEYVCGECLSDHYSQCGRCSSWHSDLPNYCESCEESYCGDYSCDEEHADCAYSGTGSVSESLSRPAVPGRTIVSLRGIGFEVERNCDYSSEANNVARALNAKRLLLESHGEHCGHEFVLLPQRGANVETAIVDTFAILDDEGMTGVDDCGLHFHLDFSRNSDAEILRAVVGLRIVEEVLFSLTGDGNDEEIGVRRTSTWCRPSTTGYSRGVVDCLRAAEAPAGSTDRRGYRRSLGDVVGQNSRYCGINTHAHSEHQTVEIRILDAALDSYRVLVAAGIAAGVADYAIASTTGTLQALNGSPLALIYRAAKAGFIAPSAMRYAEERYSAFLPTIAAERAAEIAEIERTARREAARSALTAAQNVALAEFELATRPAAEVRNALREAAMLAVEHARRAYDSACETQQRVRDAADRAYSMQTADARALRDAAYEAARMTYDGVMIATPRACSCGCGMMVSS